MSEIKVICKDCGKEFIISEAEQAFYAQKGFQMPKRCAACRKYRRDEKELAQLLERLPYRKLDVSEIAANRPESTLFVLGNGFDIMHGVKSSYNDFQKTLGKHSALREALELYLDCDDLWYNFEESLAHLNAGAMLDTTDMWMEEFNAYDPDAQAADYCMAIDYAMMPIETITDQLPRRFRAWVERLTAEEQRPFAHCMAAKAHYLNFNYTDFPELLYGVAHQQICYIHGCRRREKGKSKDELILGHIPDVDYLKDYVHDEGMMPEDPGKRAWVEMAQEQAIGQWVNYYSDTFTKNTSAIIGRNEEFFAGAGMYEEIYVIGHSLSEVDYPYFIELAKRNGNRATWHFGYHSLADMKRLVKLVGLLNVEKVEVFRT